MENKNTIRDDWTDLIHTHEKRPKKKIDRECNVEKYLKDKVENLGGLSFKFPATHYTGVPDRICLLPGAVIFFAELKTTNKKPSKIQLFVHKTLRRLGFRVEVIDSVNKINEVLEGYNF